MEGLNFEHLSNDADEHNKYVEKESKGEKLTEQEIKRKTEIEKLFGEESRKAKEFLDEFNMESTLRECVQLIIAVPGTSPLIYEEYPLMPTATPEGNHRRVLLKFEGIREKKHCYHPLAEQMRKYEEGSKERAILLDEIQKQLNQEELLVFFSVLKGNNSVLQEM